MEHLLFSAFTIISEEQPKLPKEFIVSVDDEGELYLRSLVEMMKKSINVDNKTVKHTKYGDYIVFTKHNVELEKNFMKVIEKDLPILSLVKDYNKVEKAVKNFFSKVYEPEKEVFCITCPLFQLGICKGIETPKKKKNKTIFYDGEYVTTEEKVSIFYNFVKVGYDQYDILVDYKTGKEFVEIEGDLFAIKSNLCGKKYLELVK